MKEREKNEKADADGSNAHQTKVYNGLGRYP
jgi:hypothetical protein